MSSMRGLYNGPCVRLARRLAWLNCQPPTINSNSLLRQPEIQIDFCRGWNGFISFEERSISTKSLELIAWRLAHPPDLSFNAPSTYIK